MTPLSCDATEELLQAFHDRELPVTEQIAVGAHVEWCEQCAASLADLREMGSALSALAPGRRALSNEQAAVFSATIVNRLKAEEAASLLGARFPLRPRGDRAVGEEEVGPVAGHGAAG